MPSPDFGLPWRIVNQGDKAESQFAIYDRDGRCVATCCACCCYDADSPPDSGTLDTIHRNIPSSEMVKFIAAAANEYQRMLEALVDLVRFAKYAQYDKGIEPGVFSIGIDKAVALIEEHKK